jgi:hypothetical protein
MGPPHRSEKSLSGTSMLRRHLQIAGILNPLASTLPPRRRKNLSADDLVMNVAPVSGYPQ